jgi:hypothetical protein
MTDRPTAATGAEFGDAGDTDPQDSQQGTQLDETELLERIKRQFREARNASAEWRKAAREDFAFYSSDQWDANDVTTLKEQLRPVVTFNRIGPTVDTVAGMEINNRQEIQAYPRSEGDAGLNEFTTNAIKWVRDECDAEDEESDLFADSIICGMGWSETRMDYDRDPDGLIVQERIDPLEMFFDPYARKRNLIDRRYQFHRKELDAVDARAMFPDVEPSELHAGWAAAQEDDSGSEIHDATEAKFYKNDQTANEAQRRKVTIIHAQWVEKEPYFRVTDPTTGQMQSFSPAEYRQLKKRLATVMPGVELPAVKQTKRVIKRAFVGNIVLEVGDAPCKDDFTFQCVTGKRDRNKKSWYGIVRAMKDPQRWSNKFFSTMMHTMATSGKGIMAEKDAFDNPRQAEDEWARTDGITWVKPGALVAGKIQPKPIAQMPPGLPDMLQFALSSLQAVSGINLETLGQADRDQAASLEWQRRKSAFSILAAFFDGLRHYRKTQGRLTIYFIQEYISDGRLMRVEGPNGDPQYIQLLRQPDTVEYDIIVDDAPSSPDQKEQTWLLLGQMMPFLAKMPIPAQVWTEVIKQSPLPDSFTSKVANLLEQQAQQPPPPDPAMMKVQADIQAQQAKLQADMQAAQQRMQLESQLKQQELAMQAQTEQVQQQAELARNQAEAQVDAHTAQVKAELAAVELQHKMELERQRMIMEMQLEREKAANELEIARQKASADQDIQREKLERDHDVASKAAGVKAAKIKNGKAVDEPDETSKVLKELLTHLGKPRKIVRDKNGRATGVE